MNTKTQKNYFVLNAFKEVFKNYLFIFFSFVNLFIPLFSTIMAALNKPVATIDVIGVGLSTSFITIFNQFLFLLSLCIVFVYIRQKNIEHNDNIDRNSIGIIVLVMSLISIVLFVGLSFLYIEFSGIYKNINASIIKGFEYVAIVSPTLLFNVFIYLEIMHRHTEDKHSSFRLLLLFFALNLILIPLIGVLPNWPENLSTFGIGLGMLSSSLITFIYVWLINKKEKRHYVVGFKQIRIKHFLNKIKNFIFNFLLSTIMKSILIMAVALSLGLAQRDGTPLGLMIAKIVWYNSLFFCGFYADGLLYTIEYTRLEHMISNDEKYQTNFKVWNLLALSGTIITTIVVICFSFASIGLAKLYTVNQVELIPSPTDGLEALGWPYKGNASQEAIDYLWSPQGMFNFQLVDTTNKTIGKSTCFALLYTGIYHVIINSTKLLSFVDIKLDQKFNWKKLISNFIVISFVMIFVVVFSVVPKSYGYLKTFGGIDNFSFSLMLVAILLFILTILGHLSKMKQSKKQIKP